MRACLKVPHSADCGSQMDLVLFIAVLAAPTGRSRRSRQVHLPCNAYARSCTRRHATHDRTLRHTRACMFARGSILRTPHGRPCKFFIHSRNILCVADLTPIIAALPFVPGQVLRDTWFKLANPRVAIRFFLALNDEGQVPDDVIDEADTKKDMVFVDTTDAYKNLFRKVNLLFKWICDYCPHVVHILKTDDDSFVRVDKLLTLMKTLPRERLYYGSFLRRMPGRIRNKTTKILTNDPLPGNKHNFPEWPWYASGAGYILSHDLAKGIAYPPLPVVVQSAEDRGIGMQLYGRNVSYVSDKGMLRPWGHCSEGALLLHYQRDHGMLRRRYDRAIKGINICGEGWKSNQKCQLVDQYGSMEFKCDGGTTARALRCMRKDLLLCQ